MELASLQIQNRIVIWLVEFGTGRLHLVQMFLVVVREHVAMLMASVTQAQHR
jgi:hypothetical protein